MAQEEAERIYTSRVQGPMTKAAEKALSDAFQVVFESAKNGLKNASYHFLKSILTEMAQNGGLDDVFDRNIERWTQSSTFMDAFTRRTLTSSRFVRPVAKIIRKILIEQTKENEQEPKHFDSPVPFSRISACLIKIITAVRR